MTQTKPVLKAVPDAQERRTLERTHEELDAIYLPDQGPGQPCKIVDFSMMGACLQHPSAAELPDEITVFVPAFGLTYDAEVRWRQSDRLGLVFTRAERTGPSNK